MAKKTPVLPVDLLKVFASEVDELGEVRLKMSTLKKRETELATSMKERMKVGEVIITDRFRAELSESNNRVLNMAQVRKVLGQKKFFELAKVGVGDLEKVLGKEEIDQVTEKYDPIKNLSVKPIA